MSSDLKVSVGDYTNADIACIFRGSRKFRDDIRERKVAVSKDTAKVSGKGKLRFAKRPFPDAIILITAHIYNYVKSANIASTRCKKDAPNFWLSCSGRA